MHTVMPSSQLLFRRDGKKTLNQLQFSAGAGIFVFQLQIHKFRHLHTKCQEYVKKKKINKLATMWLGCCYM